MDVVVCPRILQLMRDIVKKDYPACYPCNRPQRTKLTPYQVQCSTLVFLLELGTPALHPRPAGKGTGRQKNYRLTPRPRYQVVFKSKKTQKLLSASPCSVFAFLVKVRFIFTHSCVLFCHSKLKL